MNQLKEKLYRIKRNQIRMIHARGYLLPQEEPLELQRLEFMALFAGDKPNWRLLNNRYLPPSGGGNPPYPHIPPIFLFYLINVDGKVKDKDLLEQAQSIIEKESTEIKNFILITSEKTKLERKLPEKLEPDIRLSVIDWNLLRVDLPTHVRNPYLFRLLSPEERQELLKKFRVNNLPKMFVSDPMSVYYGAKGGDIFYIRRRNQIAKILLNQKEYYRLVVDLSAPTTDEVEGEAEDQPVDEFDFDQPDEIALVAATE